MPLSDDSIGTVGPCNPMPAEARRPFHRERVDAPQGFMPHPGGSIRAFRAMPSDAWSVLPLSSRSRDSGARKVAGSASKASDSRIRPFCEAAIRTPRVPVTRKPIPSATRVALRSSMRTRLAFTSRAKLMACVSPGPSLIVGSTKLGDCTSNQEGGHSAQARTAAGDNGCSSS